MTTATPARFRVLELLKRHFGPGDVLIDTHSPSQAVAAQAFRTKAGRELLLLCHDMFRAMERFEEGYDRPADPLPIPPWPSHSRARSPSRWKQRALQCPRARRRPNRVDGAS